MSEYFQKPRLIEWIHTEEYDTSSVPEWNILTQYLDDYPDARLHILVGSLDPHMLPQRNQVLYESYALRWICDANRLIKTNGIHEKYLPIPKEFIPRKFRYKFISFFNRGGIVRCNVIDKFAEYKMTDQEKRAFRTGLKEHAWYAFHTILLSTYFAMRGSGDDEEGVWAYLLYMWKRIYNETETYSPVSPVNYVLARIHEPQRSGSSSTKNSFTDATINFFFKMVDDNIVSPITGRHGGEAMGLMIDVPDWFDPYYGKFYKRGHGPDSRSPRVDRERAKTLMPHLAGKPNLIVGLLKFFNQSQSVIFYPKQAENYQSLYNYNIYMLPGEPLFIKKKKAK
ncbi:hypothetical protein EBU71_22390, partial [bacterium]|nr:hypothetical protein [Candidatus Elulimicrobium humile]